MQQICVMKYSEKSQISKNNVELVGNNLNKLQVSNKKIDHDVSSFNCKYH